MNFEFATAGRIVFGPGCLATALAEVPRHGSRALVVTGSGISLLAVIGMFLAFFAGWYHPLALFLPMYAIGFGNGLTLANALAGAAQDDELQAGRMKEAEARRNDLSRICSR